MEKLTVLHNVILLEAGTAVLGESQYTPATGRRTCPASYLTFAGLVHIPVSLGRECCFFHMVVLASNFHVSFVVSSFLGDISRARTIFNANVVLLPEQETRHIQMLIWYICIKY